MMKPPNPNHVVACLHVDMLPFDWPFVNYNLTLAFNHIFCDILLNLATMPNPTLLIRNNLPTLTIATRTRAQTWFAHT